MHAYILLLLQCTHHEITRSLEGKLFFIKPKLCIISPKHSYFKEIIAILQLWASKLDEKFHHFLCFHGYNFKYYVEMIFIHKTIKDVLLNELSISAKEELQSLCCMMGKTMSLRYHFLAANGRRLIDWIQKKIKLST